MKALNQCYTVTVCDLIGSEPLFKKFFDRSDKVKHDEETNTLRKQGITEEKNR
jgi:hypothetical protein